MLPLEDHILEPFLSHNNDTRLPEQMDQWIPSFLTDVWYACCAYNTWKALYSADLLKTMSKEEYYDESAVDSSYNPEDDFTGGDSDDTDKGHDNVDAGVTQQSQMLNTRKSPRKRRLVKDCSGNGNSPGIEAAMDFVFALWTRSTAEEIENRKRRQEEMEKQKEEENITRVRNWLSANSTTV
jgi:hypothetical protein